MANMILTITLEDESYVELREDNYEVWNADGKSTSYGSIDDLEKLHGRIFHKLLTRGAILQTL